MNNAPTILIKDEVVQIRNLRKITVDSNDYKTIFVVNAKEGPMMLANYQPDFKFIII